MGLVADILYDEATVLRYDRPRADAPKLFAPITAIWGPTSSSGGAIISTCASSHKQ